MFYGSTNNDNKIIRNIILQRKHLENISFDFVHISFKNVRLYFVKIEQQKLVRIVKIKSI